MDTLEEEKNQPEYPYTCRVSGEGFTDGYYLDIDNERHYFSFDTVYHKLHYAYLKDLLPDANGDQVADIDMLICRC